jgi:HlyD family secretion protein
MRRIVVFVSPGSVLKLAIALAVVVALSGIGFWIYGPTPAIRAATQPVEAKPASSSPSKGVSISVASPGRIEAQSDAIEVGGGVDGVIRSIFIREGQNVRRGQVLAELECGDLKSALAVAQAEAESSRRSRDRLLRGSRAEERDAAGQKTESAKAILAQASALLDRNKGLVATDSISHVTYEEALRNAKVAEAEYRQAQRYEQLVNAGPLPEEIARANAEVQAAEERIQFAQERLEKCVIRAPLNGTVLRVVLREGESFSLSSPRPLFTIANTLGRRVRAEVDERDVGRVHIGQSVIISSDAYSGRRFNGSVTRLATMMGKKSVLTGDPADKADRDILEVTAQLQNATELPVGLRVTVEFVE